MKLHLSNDSGVNLFTGYGELMFFTGAPLTPVNQRLRTLVDGYLPMVEYTVEDHGVRFHLTLFTATLDGRPSSNPINFVRIEAHNISREPRATAFAAGIRYINSPDPRISIRYRFKRPSTPDPGVPYEKLPYDVRYYMEGALFNPAWKYTAARDWLARDGRILLLTSKGGHWKVNAATEPDTVGGIVEFPLHLSPGERRQIVLKMPTRPAGKTEADSIRSASFDTIYQRTAAWWRNLLNSGLVISLPETKVADAFKASLAYCYLARDSINGDYRQTPGKLNYHAFYLRDSSVFAQAYDLTGHPDDARKVLDYFLKWQQPDGNFVSDMWDGWGQVLWIFGEHAELNRDRDFARRVYPSVEKAIRWLETERARDPYHIFPAGPVVDAEYLKGRWGHPTGWNFLGLGGLRGAMKLARVLGRKDDVTRYQKLYDDWNAAFLKRLDEIAPRIGGRIPPGLDDATGQDGATWFNVNSLYPIEILAPFDPRVTATLEYSRGRYIEGVTRWEGNDRVRAAGGPPRVHGYLTAINTESALIRGEQKQALREFYAMLAHSTATHGASEQLMPGTRDPRNQPQPHGWYASNYIVLLRHMLIRERDGDLHLLSAVSPEWLKPGDEISVSRAPTAFGPMDLRVRRDPKRVHIELRPRFHTPPRAIVVHVPWFLRDAMAEPRDEIRLGPGATTIDLKLLRNPVLPVMNHAAAVAEILREFEATKPYWTEWVTTGHKPVNQPEPRSELFR